CLDAVLVMYLPLAGTGTREKRQRDQLVYSMSTARKADLEISVSCRVRCENSTEARLREVVNLATRRGTEDLTPADTVNPAVITRVVKTFETGDRSPCFVR